MSHEKKVQASGQIEGADSPHIGKAYDINGIEIEQVGKHPDVPPEVPVQAGSALDPSLPPPATEAQEPQEPDAKTAPAVKMTSQTDQPFPVKKD